MPNRDKLRVLIGDGMQPMLQEADEIIAGKVHLFGAEAVPLDLAPKDSHLHWTATRIAPGEDIKFIWEPARFGWAFSLGRAYRLSGDERYAAAFWQYWELFTKSNPVNCGANWESGQEVALRLIAYLFAFQVFEDSPQTSDDRKVRLLQAIVDHASRIPPTMIYARAQDNNHLVSEACALYLAGVALPDHPKSESWREAGWRWLEFALRTQFDADGIYVQHSMNYHRMVLQLAMLGLAAARRDGREYSPAVWKNLAAGTRWLVAQLDTKSGDAPNLGNNDGAHILPLASGSFRDHRPTAQAASAAFLGRAILPAGPWDELAVWLGIDTSGQWDLAAAMSSPAVRRLGNLVEWATLRAVHFRTRPAHADQLHVELWFNGVNVLRDAGTYAYSLNSPWNNSLVYSRFHNTLVIDEEDPMLRAGRFLWLRWDQAHWVEEACKPGLVTAEHDGYIRIGYKHQRSLEWVRPGQWEVTDRVSSTEGKVNQRLTLHWLVMDGQWSLDGHKLSVTGKNERVTINIKPEPYEEHMLFDQRLVRSGVTLYGNDAARPNEGWYSPTYSKLEPAISFQTGFNLSESLVIRTQIYLEKLA